MSLKKIIAHFYSREDCVFAVFLFELSRFFGRFRRLNGFKRDQAIAFVDFSFCN